MNTRRMVELYQAFGFKPIPLSPMSKEPRKGISLATAHLCDFRAGDNIGLFPGSENGLAVIDADSQASQIFVTNRLKNLGLYDWVTIVRTPKRGGLHFWLRVENTPAWVQTYYKLPEEVGAGEFRFRQSAYVVAPGSRIAEGEYVFLQGGMSFFDTQPAIDYRELSWALPPHAMFERMVSSADIPIKQIELPQRRYVADPGILGMLQYLCIHHETTIPKYEIKARGFSREKSYRSRSEAELGFVYGLIWNGWSYDQIRDLFDTEQPGHFSETPDQNRYFDVTFAKAAAKYVENRNSMRSTCRSNCPERLGKLTFVEV